MRPRRGTTIALGLRSASAALLATLLLAGPALAAPNGPDPRQETWRLALAAGEYGHALELTESEPTPLQRTRARAEILYLGRDFAGCLATADDALEQAPGDLALLHYAAASALWLRDGELAELYLRDLEAALPETELSAEQRTWWNDTARSFGAQAAELRAAGAARAEAVLRARRTVTALGSLTLALLLWAGFRSGR